MAATPIFQLKPYVRIGSYTTPAATTAGNLTVDSYLALGVDAASSLNNRLLNAAYTNTSTSSTETMAGLYSTVTPASNSTATHRNMVLQTVVNPSTGVTAGTSIQSGFFDIRWRSDTAISTLTGLTVHAVSIDGSSPATTGTITTAKVFEAVLHRRTGGTSASTITNGTCYSAVGINNASSSTTVTTLTMYGVTNPASGNTITTLLGLDVPALTRGATSNIGIRIAAPSGATNNYAIQLSDTGGTAAGGITFGTDTTLYRSAADTLKTDDSFAAVGSIRSSGTGGVGYATGAGGTVTQLTDKSTGVTLSKICGQITLNNASLAADTTVTFTLTNTTIAAGDVLVLNHVSGGTAGAYTLNAQSAAGSATINVRNVTAGSLGEAIVIGFAVIKGVTS